MKLRSLLLTAILSVTTSLHADWVIVQKTKSTGKEKAMTIKIKDHLMRNDIGDSMTMIMDTKEGMTQMFMHSSKSVMKMSSDTMKGMAGLANQFLNKPGQQASKPKATGDMVKVGEWDAEVYTWESKLGTGKFYVCKSFPKFEELNKAMDKITKSMSNPMSAMFPSFTEFPGMVVKTEMTMMGQSSTSELVSAKEQPVSDDEMKGPEGYKEMQIPKIPGGGLGK